MQIETKQASVAEGRVQTFCIFWGPRLSRFITRAAIVRFHAGQVTRTGLPAAIVAGNKQQSIWSLWWCHICTALKQWT